MSYLSRVEHKLLIIKGFLTHTISKALLKKYFHLLLDFHSNSLIITYHFSQILKDIRSVIALL